MRVTEPPAIRHRDSVLLTQAQDRLPNRVQAHLARQRWRGLGDGGKPSARRAEHRREPELLVGIRVSSGISAHRGRNATHHGRQNYSLRLVLRVEGGLENAGMANPFQGFLRRHPKLFLSAFAGVQDIGILSKVRDGDNAAILSNRSLNPTRRERHGGISATLREGRRGPRQLPPSVPANGRPVAGRQRRFHRNIVQRRLVVKNDERFVNVITRELVIVG